MYKDSSITFIHEILVFLLSTSSGTRVHSPGDFHGKLYSFTYSTNMLCPYSVLGAMLCALGYRCGQDIHGPCL